MKKIKLLAILAPLMVALLSCSEKGTEETKMISSSAIKTSGEHSNLLSVDADSVKIMLVKVSDDNWEVRAILPLANVRRWKSVPGSDPSAANYYEPTMGNMEVKFLDANGTPLNLNLKVDYDVVRSLLSSNTYKTEDFVITNLSGGDYKAKKTLFDKVAGISIKRMDLAEVHTSSGSSNSSSSSSGDSDDDDDDDDDDWDDVEKAAKASKSAYKAAKAAYKVAKEIDDDDWDW